MAHECAHWPRSRRADRTPPPLERAGIVRSGRRLPDRHPAGVDAIDRAGVVWDRLRLVGSTGAGHSARLLRTELSWLDRDFTTPLAAGRLIEWADWGARQLYHWSGLQGFVRWVVADPPAPGSVWNDPAGAAVLGRVSVGAAYITQLVGARLVVVVLTLPAYAMIGVMSLVDGLVQRDLRRFGGGLESGLLYHHLKAMLRPMLSLPIFLYLISPWSLHPTTIFVPFVLGFGYFVQRTVARFKKYL